MVWQVTHYLCRYPPVAGSFSPPFFPPSLSICQRMDKIPLSWRLSRDYPGVPGESGRGAEIPQYSCSKGYSKFNGPEVVERRGRSQRQASSFRHSLALWLALQPHSGNVGFEYPKPRLVYLACLRGSTTTIGKNVRSALALLAGTLNGSSSD